MKNDDDSPSTRNGRSVNGSWKKIPNLPAKGEEKKKAQLYQKQVAKTIAELPGVEYNPKHTVVQSLTEVFK